MKKFVFYLNTVAFLTVLFSFVGLGKVYADCFVESVLGQNPYTEPCTSGSGSSVACANSSWNCCPIVFEGGLTGYSSVDNYASLCTNMTELGAENANDSTWISWGWQVENNGGSSNRVLSPCSDGNDTSVSGGPNYNSLCDAGYRVLGVKWNTVFNDYKLFCAYDDVCTTPVGGACNNTPLPPTGTPGQPVQACDDFVTGVNTDILCRYASPSSQSGTCAICAGGGATTPEVFSPNIPERCDVAAGVLCCDPNGVPYMTCQEVFANPLPMAGGGNSTKGCVLPPANDPDSSMLCGGKGATGAICWEDSQCASGICDWVGGETLKKCQPSPLGASCAGPDGDCYCNTAEGQECREDPDNAGDYICSFPCHPPYPDPDSECIIGISCCENVGGLVHECQMNYDVNPPRSYCMPTTEACIGDGGECIPGVETCCSTDRTCQATGLTPPAPQNTCQVDTCTAFVGDACPNGVADCCPTTNPTWGCEPDGSGVLKCTDTPTQGQSCTGTGCCDGAPGFVCQNGNCIPSDICDPTVDVFPYTGPIISFDDLLARIYSLLYPAGIFIGVLLIGKSGYTLMTSEGNPQKVKQGQEELTSAILGVFFILLSIVIIRVIIKSILGVTL